MTNVQLHEFARIGAEARLKAIADERQAILTVFPDLGNGTASTRRVASAAPRQARRRVGMSPTQRRAVGERMKAYWAKRRAEKAGAGVAADAPTPSGGTRRRGMSAEARKAQAERMKAFWAAKRAEKQAGADGAPTQAAGSSRKSGRKAGRKQGRKK
jgi:hypothetical protein